MSLIFMDFEFYEDGRIIDPISVGMVRDDDAEYYAEFEEFDWGVSTEPWLPDSAQHMFVMGKEWPWVTSPTRDYTWLNENVKPHLTGELKSRGQIKQDILEFVGESPSFWGYYADYDHVLLCQLFGRMIDLPKGWPMLTLDLKQLCMMQGNPKLLKQTDAEHHALADARWIRDSYLWLKRNA
jgi:hypothetical protein